MTIVIIALATVALVVSAVVQRFGRCCGFVNQTRPVEKSAALRQSV